MLIGGTLHSGALVASLKKQTCAFKRLGFPSKHKVLEARLLKNSSIYIFCWLRLKPSLSFNERAEPAARKSNAGLFAQSIIGTGLAKDAKLTA